MGKRGNQTFLKNQKAQKRTAKANAKQAQRQARRDDKTARAAAGESPGGAPIDWEQGGEGVPRDPVPDETADSSAPAEEKKTP